MTDDRTTPILVRAALLGVVSGARSFTPLGVLALHRGEGSTRTAWQDWPVFRSPAGRGTLVVAALGELVGDKLPATPARTSPLPLIGRSGTGAIAAFAVAGGSDRLGVRIAAALLGAAGAVAGSYAGFLLRGAAGRATGLPDVVFALVEDAITIGGSAALVRSA